MGTPRLSASSTVFTPAWVINSAARSSRASCGAKSTTIALPGTSPELLAHGPSSSLHLPSARTSCASRPAQAARILRKTGRLAGSGTVPSEAKIKGRPPGDPRETVSAASCRLVGQRADVVKVSGSRGRGKSNSAHNCEICASGEKARRFPRSDGSSRPPVAIDDLERRPDEPMPGGIAQAIAPPAQRPSGIGPRGERRRHVGLFVPQQGRADRDERNADSFGRGPAGGDGVVDQHAVDGQFLAGPGGIKSQRQPRPASRTSFAESMCRRPRPDETPATAERRRKRNVVRVRLRARARFQLLGQRRGLWASPTMVTRCPRRTSSVPSGPIESRCPASSGQTIA